MPRIVKLFIAFCAAVALVGTVLFGADQRTTGLLLTTLQLSLAVVAISVPSGILLACLVSRTDVIGRRVVFAMLTTMLFVPLYLQAAGWDAGFGRQGWLSLASETAQPLLSGMRAAVWIHSLAAIPWVVLMVSVALRHSDPELEEFALLDHSAVAVFWKVILPQLSPTVAVAALWVCVLTATEMTVTDLYQVRTFAEEIYTTVPLLDESLTGSSNEVTLPQGTAVLLALFVAGFAIASSLVRRPLTTPVRPPALFNLGAWRYPAALVLVVGLLFIVGVPLGNLCYNAGLQVAKTNAGILREWSPGKAFELLLQTPGSFPHEFGWSATIGAVTASLCLLVGAPLAWIARSGGWRAGPAILLMVFGTAIPGPIIGLWLVRLISQSDQEWLAWFYDHSILAPVLATAIRALPAAILVCWYGFQTVSTDLVEAATLDRLGPITLFLKVIVPNRWQVLAATWLVALIISTGDLTASILVTPPGLFTVPVRVFGLLHAGVDDHVAGLCLTIVGVMLMLQLVLVRLVRKIH